MTKKKAASTNTPRTSAEWVSLVISILLLAGVVGTVAALWLGSSNSPARFRVERGTPRNEAGHYYLPIKVTNEGDTTGAQVTVEGKLKVSENEETASTTFDFIPARSTAEGILIFVSEPGSAEVRVISYQQP
ncbi:MAG TPA: hypothetical protein VJS44_14215 [Pyrinomonadaceae bacterium]|nr:hypothetical protein [Pyrinomonadaceae bacterium]